MRRLESLTGARFFAAIAVLLFHFMALITGPKALELPASFGRIGVCFFFVLSGFVLAYNYRDRFIAGGISKNYRQFFWARFVRVIPSHVLLLLLITPLCLWLNARGALMAASSSPVVPAPTAAASWFANLFLVQVYFPRREFEMMWNAPAWSIACEVVFYLLFPLLMLALSRIANSPSKLIAAGLGFWMLETVAVMASLYVFRRMHQSILPETKFDFYFSRMPFIRVGEFATGCCAGLLFLRLQDQSKSLSGNRLSILSLIVGGICLACFGSLAFFRYTSWFLAFVPAFTVIIIALASNATIWSSLLQHPVVLVLGEASYALYLLQWTAFLLIRYLYGEEAPGWVLSTGGAACIGMSVLFLLYVDIPIRRLLRGRTAADSEVSATFENGLTQTSSSHPPQRGCGAGKI